MGLTPQGPRESTQQRKPGPGPLGLTQKGPACGQVQWLIFPDVSRRGKMRRSKGTASLIPASDAEAQESGDTVKHSWKQELPVFLTLQDKTQTSEPLMPIQDPRSVYQGSVHNTPASVETPEPLRCSPGLLGESFRVKDQSWHGIARCQGGRRPLRAPCRWPADTRLGAGFLWIAARHNTTRCQGGRE